MNAIEVSGLRYSYGDFTAVDGVDFTVADGEVFALLGTNGAGKTTTLEIIEGFRAPDAGTVRVLGQDPHRARTALAPSVGVMLQESGFVGEMTVAETVALWGRISGRADDPAAVLARLDLAHRAGVAVEQLSGGERRRLDVALAVWGRPRLVVLDEPSTGLDPESRQRVWALIEDLAAGGTTVLLTTHYLEEAEALADRVAIMHAGRIVREGTPAQLGADQPSTIRFQRTDVLAGLGELPGTVRLVSDHGMTTVETLDLQTTLTALLADAANRGVRLPHLEARSASLESVFLAIAAGTDPGGAGAALEGASR
jgi:ABC-2 type transport system ATP-binding protein